MDNYQRLMERIGKSSGLEKEEIERKIEAKRAKLSGLISKEGAAQIVAAELGIRFEDERVKLSELVQGMRKANVLGKITQIYPVREFKKNGREGKIGSFLLGDESSNIRVVLWDVNHIDLIEKSKFKVGDTIEIMGGGYRNGELHLGNFSDMKKSKEKVGEVMLKRDFEFGKLKDAHVGQNVKVRAVIVQAFEPRQFTSKKDGKPGALLNIVLDDGTETIRAVLFGDTIKKLGLDEEQIKSAEKFNGKKGEMLGDERIFSGNFRMNNYFNRVEMTIDNVEDVNVDELLKELESKL